MTVGTPMEPGDLIFCHSHGFVARAIRLAERLRWRPGSFYNHVAVLAEPVRGDWRVIQAEGHGVTDSGLLSELAPGGSYAVVPCPAIRPSVLTFARMQVGRPYGFMTIVSIVATLFTPSFLNVMLPNTWICSALAAESLRAGGWLHNWPDLYQTSPAQLWEALH